MDEEEVHPWNNKEMCNSYGGVWKEKYCTQLYIHNIKNELTVINIPILSGIIT